MRVALVERAALLLARREPVTLRAIVEGTGATTMAVYTHFGGMAGLWRAVRQEGFTRLAAQVRAVEPSADPVHDLAALGAAYTRSALASPYLYRLMFDDAADLDDPEAAAATFELLVACAARARATGRFSAASDPGDVATRFWATGHGMIMLVLTGVLPSETLARHAPAVAQALFVAAGDEPAACARSVEAAWSTSG